MATLTKPLLHQTKWLRNGLFGSRVSMPNSTCGAIDWLGEPRLLKEQWPLVICSFVSVILDAEQRRERLIEE
jgi:hypothetical protein